MMHGRNNGKKLMAVRIVAHAFEIVSSSAPWFYKPDLPHQTPTSTSTNTRREYVHTADIHAPTRRSTS